MARGEQSSGAGREPRIVRVHEDTGNGAAVVFVHGFTGSAGSTWGDFPTHLRNDARLRGWNLYSLGYRTDLRIDVPLWKAKPNLARLGELLRTAAGSAPLGDHEVLALVAHSMGGLVVQRALVDDPELVRRTGQVALFGTPSGGLRKVGWLRLLNRQVGDMWSEGPFITDLRSRWDARFGHEPPFAFVAVAGDQDEFVPAASSLEPFDDAHRRVVYGDHLEIVKPASAEDLSVELLTGFLAGEGAPAGPWNSALIAIERREFRSAVERLWPHRAELDDRHVVHLALALEELGDHDEAVGILEEHAEREGAGTDPLGVLAGRLKRRWLAEGRQQPAERALELYRQGLERSAAADDHDQAFYHAINVAFLELAFRDDRAAARASARTALDHCERHAAEEGEDRWSRATRGEAALVLGDGEGALEAYRQALGHGPSPLEIESMFRQAIGVANVLGQDRTAGELEALFRPSLADEGPAGEDPA